MNKKMVEVQLEAWDNGLVNDNSIDEMIEFFEELKNKYGSHNTFFRQTHSADSYSASVSTHLMYLREETDEEFSVRVKEREEKMKGVKKRIHKYRKREK